MWFPLALVAFATFLLWKFTQKPSNYPPGFWGIPLFGHFPFDSSQIFPKVVKASKTMGNVIYWRMGSLDVVFLMDYSTIKKLFATDMFSSRVNVAVTNFFHPYENSGIVGSWGNLWHNSRRFALKHLRDLGMGKTRTVGGILEEAEDFVTALEKLKGAPACIPRALKINILNVSWKLITSERFDHDDPELTEFNKLFDTLFTLVGKIIVIDMLPWLRMLLPKVLIDYIFYDEFNNVRRLMDEFFKRTIEKHRKTLDEDNPRDFVDVCLIEMNKTNGQTDQTMDENNVIMCVGDLFLGSNFTTFASVEWLIAYLAAYPDIQKKVQEEVDRVLPGDTVISGDNMNDLHFARAVIYETQRMIPIVPNQAGGRKALADVNIDGYHIPKGTMVIATPDGCHFDPNIWKNPLEYNPYRFINSSGHVEPPKAGYIPFGIGKRSCVGEPVAKLSLQVFLTTLMKNFTIYPATGKVNLTPGLSNFFARQLDVNQKFIFKKRSAT